MKFLHFRYKFLLILLFSFASSVYANNDVTSRHLAKQLHSLEKSFNGKIGIYAIDTANNNIIQYHATDRFPIQSTFKLLLVSAVLQKSEKDHHLLQKHINYKTSDLIFWSPITEKNVSSGMSIADLCAATLQYSDNTAASLLMKKIGGPASITLFARFIGDPYFRLNNWEPNLNSNPNKLADTSTPKGMAESLNQLVLGNTLKPNQRQQLITWMKGNTTGDKQIRSVVPEGWIVADKTGGGNTYGIVNDIAVIWPPNRPPLILAIYTVQKSKHTIRKEEIVAQAAKLALLKLETNS